jgi:hypothetical protein
MRAKRHPRSAVHDFPDRLLDGEAGGASMRGAGIDGSEVVARLRALGFEVASPKVLASPETCYP